VLEVGLPGGTQGWLKIRAEVGEGGTVQASLSAATPAGREALSKDLPAMTSFLQSEGLPGVNLQMAHAAHVGVAVVGGAQGGSATGSGGSDGSGGQGSSGGLMPGGGDGSGQAGRSPREQASGSDGLGGGRAAGEGTEVEGVAGVAEPEWQSAGAYSGSAGLNGGSWLNVIV